MHISINLVQRNLKKYKTLRKRRAECTSEKLKPYREIINGDKVIIAKVVMNMYINV